MISTGSEAVPGPYCRSAYSFCVLPDSPSALAAILALSKAEFLELAMRISSTGSPSVTEDRRLAAITAMPAVRSEAGGGFLRFLRLTKIIAA